MTDIQLSAETLERAQALCKLFGDDSVGETVGSVVDRFHDAYLNAYGRLPDGWKLNDDLTLEHMEAYFDAYKLEKGDSAWAERGRAIRAAITAGWFVAPDGLSVEDANKLRPAAASRLKVALDAHYVRLVTEDPNS
jgi:hypothetical protein